jgi:hypothetical protein
MDRSLTRSANAASRARGPRLVRCALSLAGVLAYFTVAASASAFGPEPAPVVEATSAVASVAPSPAPDAPVAESVELGQYHGSDTTVTAPLPDPAATDQPAESSQPVEDSARPAHPGVTRHHSEAKAGVSPHGWIAAARAEDESQMLHKVQHRTPERGKWYRPKNYQYQFENSTTPTHAALQREIQPMRSHSSSPIEYETERPILAWIRRHADHLKAQNHGRTDVLKCPSNFCESAGIEQALGLVSMLKAADTEALEEAGRRFIVRAPRPSPAPVRSEVLSGGSASNLSRLYQPVSGLAAGVLSKRAARAIDGHKSVTSSIVPHPGAVFRPTASIPPSAEVAERLTDTRRLVQIGLLLGMTYVGFLMLWFWTTRGRRRRLRGRARF